MTRRESNADTDAEFKTLVIKMLMEMIQYRCKIEEEVKAMQIEIKKNIQGTNSEGKETGTQVNGMVQKEETNIQPEKNEEKNEETRIQKMRRGLGTSRTSLNVPTSTS